MVSVVEHTLTDGPPLTWRAAARALRADPALRERLTTTVRAEGGAGCFWECAPARPEAPFCFVVLPSAAVAALRPDPRAFAAHLGRPGGVATFPSLGRDAELIAPAPAPGQDFAQLSRFLSHAPPAQVHRLWTAVGEAVERWWAADRGPLWVSTSGLGVSWLHVRLDSRPKYFTHRPYRAG